MSSFPFHRVASFTRPSQRTAQRSSITSEEFEKESQCVLMCQVLSFLLNLHLIRRLEQLYFEGAFLFALTCLALIFPAEHTVAYDRLAPSHPSFKLT
jgi:hypothetical protein